MIRARTRASGTGGRARRRGSWLQAVLAIPVAWAALAPDVAAAQGEDGWAAAAAGEIAFVAINGLLGGLTAGVVRELRGGSFREAFPVGALGGSVVYGGKRIAVASFPGAGFVGREVAAVGSSMVGNAGRGLRPLERITLPLGPTHLYLRPSAPSGVRLEVDLHDVWWIAYGLVESHLAFDAGASLSSGVPVFRARGAKLRRHDAVLRGSAAGGVIVLSAGLGADEPVTLAHERVHILQHDFIFQAWTGPLEDAAAGHLPANGFRRWLDFDLLWPAFRGGTALLGWSWLGAPLEGEAEFLEGR